MDDARLRAWWAHRQGLDGSLWDRYPALVLERSGWARSVGGVGPYLTFFARSGAGRQAIDQAVADLSIHELPSARGCTYVVPAIDFALALRLSQQPGLVAQKVGFRLGVSAHEVDRLCTAVVVALAAGPIDPEQIRMATGDASRSLGDEGKKKGLTTTLPLALGKLQSEGVIRRVPANGRLDQQRYLYTLWQPNPLAGFTLSDEEAATELARRYFRWIGPATLSEFQWFSGLGAKASKAAIEPLRLVPVEAGSDRLMFDDDRDDFLRFEPPKEPRYVLVSSLDAITAHRRDVRTLVDGIDWGHRLLGGREKAAGSALSDLPSHAILDRGRLVGLWEYDVEAQSVVCTTFSPQSEALHTAIANTERFIREELGDARSFSLDSPKSRAPRIAALRDQ
jgi:hypothetical protein